MNMCRHHGILLWGVKREQAVEFCVCVKDFKKMKPIVYKTKLHPQIKRKKGLPFYIERMKKNWTFYTGFLLFFFLLYFLSTFVWQIQFQGQVTYTKETLLKTVNSLQVYRGMKRNRLPCDVIEKSIRQKHPDISWVSAEEKGSLLVISIKEANPEVGRERAGRFCHLVAEKSGIVKKIVVNRGVACVKPGQKVKKGQILISGIVPVTADDETVVDKMGVVAKGEVLLVCDSKFSKEIPVKVCEKEYTGKKIYQTEYEINHKTFVIKNPIKRFNNAKKYDIITTILPKWEDLPIPFTFTKRKKEFREYTFVIRKRNRKELFKEGKRLYQKLLRQCRQDGLEILSKEAKITKQNEKIWLISGQIRFLCKKTRKKYIAESELKIDKKAEEKQDGDS